MSTSTPLALEYPGADLPFIVQRAIARCVDPSFPVAMSASVRMALAALLRRVERDDAHQVLLVRADRLAETFEKVTRTVTNWLDALQAHNLIERRQRRNGRSGRFRGLDVVLTPLAIRLLGLADPVAPSARPLRKKFSDGHTTTEERLQLKDTDWTFAGPRQANPKTRKPLPDDVEPLAAAGIPLTGVYRLMREAGRRGKRLGDIVAARLEAICKARQPFALCRHLINDPLDYAAILRIQQGEAAVQQAERAESADEAADRRWALANPGVRIPLDDGRVAVVGSVGEIEIHSTPVDSSLMRRSFRGVAPPSMASRIIRTARSAG